MDKDRIRDAILRVFADLTGLLEDDAGMAVEGQSLRCTLMVLENLATSLRTEIKKVIPMLAATEPLIAVCPAS
ncbi:MAG: hypothetical protein JKY31_13320 [Rhodobacteraceae bacterium]|nr:hypothetical protein [Paracoccaceae bacterium]